MDYFRILCLDLIAKKEQSNTIIGWSKDVAYSFEQFATKDGYFKQEVIGGTEDIQHVDLEISEQIPGIYIA
jgi:hypothetical protein